jgi:lipoprotein-anchoring transpeptidase ErfK/SrfK
MAIESIEINLKTQNCRVIATGGVRDYACSTALNGPGEQEGSGCTPRGSHRIRAIVGLGEPESAVFVARRPTGELWTEELHDAYPNRDWILGRILWLCGNEPGVNRGGRVDSQRRFIYIHGTPPSEPMGVPMSHGCVRMRLQDICELADDVSPGTLVSIVET